MASYKFFPDPAVAPAHSLGDGSSVSENLEKIIIAFDGDCLLCSRSTRWIADRDRAGRIRFTRLQDPIGQQMIAATGSPDLDSMLVRENDRVLSRSTAVLAVLRALGGIWKIPAALGKVIPRALRDVLYDFIAAHRYQWFGKGAACAMPSEALRQRLLPTDREAK